MDKRTLVIIGLIIAVGALIFVAGCLVGENRQPKQPPVVYIQTVIHDTIPAKPQPVEVVAHPHHSPDTLPTPSVSLPASVSLDTVVHQQILLVDTADFVPIDWITYDETVGVNYLLPPADEMTVKLTPAPFFIPLEIRHDTTVAPVLIPEYHVDWQAVTIISAVATVLTLIAIH